MLFCTRYIIENVFNAIDIEKQALLNTKNEKEIKYSNNIMEQYRDFLNRIEIGEN